MKIFFSTTPRAKEIYEKELDLIYQTIDSLDHTLLDRVIEQVDPKDFYNWDAEKRRDYYRSTMNQIKKADVCIFEASFPSLGVGHLIDQANKYGKAVIVLFLEGKKPFMLDSADEEKIILVQYDISNIKQELKSAIDYAIETSDVRFNFFISPAIGAYLDWISKHKKIPRSVYLRSLIERDMAENDEYHVV
jgi:FMN-dependent NADH-azoreductase